MDFTFEALKRYLVMQLIETSSMQNSKELMSDINQNALETAKTMKGINDMFGSRNNQPPPQNNILNQPNPFLPHEQQQGFNQNFQQPNYQQQSPNHQLQEEFFKFKNDVSMANTQIKNDINALKAEIFNGLQGLNHALTQLCHNMSNNQQPQNNNQQPQQQNKGS
jgi:hypothetical protein